MIDTALECSENEPDSAARAQLILAAIGHTVRYPIDMGGVRGGENGRYDADSAFWVRAN